jgi:hypothetical protein
MARQIKDVFVNELVSGTLAPLLVYVQQDDTLNLELRGDRITLYYRGGAILTIRETSYKFEGLTPKYLNGTSIITPLISNIDDYIPKAKHIIDIYIPTVKNHLGEKDIQQHIARENNYSPNSLDTDYFIIDTEYQDLGRFDIVALRWDSKASIRRLPKSFQPTITIFEVKQGFNAISGSSGMVKHINDFSKFLLSPNVSSFKSDMIDVFSQKRQLGLIKGMGKYKNVKMVAPDIDFVFVMANNKHQSSKLGTELAKIPNCRFIYANPMGYGLYARNIIDKNQFILNFL